MLVTIATSLLLLFAATEVTLHASVAPKPWLFQQTFVAANDWKKNSAFIVLSLYALCD